MSQQSAYGGQLRLRAPRLGESPLRERLHLVPPRAVQRARIPFVALIALILAGGVAGLLLFNTQMQQGAFEIEHLQAQAAALSATQQDESMQLLRMSDPQRLAAAAKRLGMVAPTTPAFLDLATGRIKGVPTAATAQNSMNIGGSGVAPTPTSLRPPPHVVIVQPTKTSTNTAKTKAGSGAASPRKTTSTGKNG
ncbi:MAG: hypothetical protein ACTHJM_16255 [Marmoricola sp.]